MSEIKIGDTQTTYILPIQSIELTNLSKYVNNPTNEKRVLWSNEYLNGETEYYKVEIVSQDVNEDDSYTESLDTYTCHICNVAVPKICFKDHNESKKHEIYKKICENILQRVSNQINLSNINNEGEKANYIYYCEPCSKAVLLKNKYKHESTDYHKKSLENIKIINDFHKTLSTDHMNFDKETEENSQSNKDNNNIGNKNNVVYVKEEILESDDDISSTESEPEKEIIKSVDIINNGTNVASSNDVMTNASPQFNSFESYVNEMISKYKLNIKAPIVKSGLVHIEVANGNTIKVSPENFHSYRELKSTVYCQICKKWISQDTRMHDVNEIHVRNIFKPIDNNFARVIDLVSSHCLLCNEVILTQSDHNRINDSHKKKLNESVIKNSASSKTLCEICNLFIDTHNFLAHVKSKKHKSKKDLVLAENKVITINKDKYYCTGCDLNLSDSVLIDHINDKNHKAKMIKIKLAQCFEYSKTCEVSFPEDKITSHIQESGQNTTELKNELVFYHENKNQATQSSTVQNNNKTTNDRVKNKASTSGITNKVPEKANNTKKTTSFDKEKLDKYYKILQYTNDTKTKVKCIACKVEVPFKDHNVIQHMEGNNHLRNVDTNYYKVLKYVNTAKTILKCRICDVNIPYELRNIIEHIDGSTHTLELKHVLKYHDIEKRPNGYYCDACNTGLTSHYFDHINSKLHLENFTSKYNIDRNILRKYAYENNDNNSIANLYRELYNNLLLHNNIKKLDAINFYCNICCIDVTRISEIDHVLGAYHRQNKGN